jgi:hypothetical protein
VSPIPASRPRIGGLGSRLPDRPGRRSTGAPGPPPPRAGLQLDDATATAYTTAAITAGYYVLWRLLEEFAGRIGWQPLRTVAGLLLGWARPPQYNGEAAK